MSTETLGKLVFSAVSLLFILTLHGNSRFESHNRQWMLALSVLWNLTDYITLAGTYFSPQIYALFVVARSALDSLLEMIWNVGYYAVIASLAHSDNTAHVLVKSWSLTRCMDLATMAVRFPALRLIDGRPLLTYVLLIASQFAYVFVIYFALRCLQMEKCNGHRLRMCMAEFVRTNGRKVLTVSECNWGEPLLFGWWFSCQPTRLYGCSLKRIPTSSPSLMSRVEPSYIVAYESRKKVGWGCIISNASEESLFIAAVMVEYAAATHGQRWPTPGEVNAFRSAMLEARWSLSPKLLGFGEWSYEARVQERDRQR